MNQHGPGLGSLSDGMAEESTNRRVVPRFRVQFRTVVSVPGAAIEGTGSVLDLSLTGCRIDSSYGDPTSDLHRIANLRP